MNHPSLAVFSDVHSNLEALEAVLSDMDSLGIENRICLGDIVGYGPNPAACLRRVRALGCPILLGNHDQAAASNMPLDYMNEFAVAGLEFSRQKLSDKQKAFLNTLPMTAEQEGCQFVHSSLIEPAAWHYITDEIDAWLHFSSQAAPLCFIGHTHEPVVWQQPGNEMPTGYEGVGKFELPLHGKTLVNVGSVGQPRDNNPEACYVVFRQDEKTVEFRRVKYDLAKTKRKISRAKLPKFLGQRLALGR